MKSLLLRLLVLCVCLTLLWLSPGAMPKSYAAGRALRQAQDGSSCDPNIPRNTGVSSDADWYGFEDSDNGQPFGYFRIGSSAAIGAWTCGSNSIVLFVSPHFPSSSVYVWTMLNGVWSLANNLPFNYYDPDSMIAPLNVQADQVYTIQVDICWSGPCQLTPHLQIATAANSLCQNGYVWRQAWGGDFVCVDPPQRDQVTADNSQALNRIVAL